MVQAEIKKHLDSLYKELFLLLGTGIKGYVAGGAIASLVLDQQPKDYDIWFETIEDWQEAASRLYDKPHTITKYASTYKLPSGKVIQLVCNRLGKPAELVKTFDFLHCQSYYLQNGTLHYDEDFIKRKVLVFSGDLDHPMNTMERCLKFSKRGYFVPSETLHNLLIGVAKMGLDKVKALPKHSGSM